MAQNEAIKNNGERDWHYDENEFWDFFCKKINYEGEHLSFLILTDQNDVSIPLNIQLDEKNGISQAAYHRFLINLKNINVISKPQISFETKSITRKSRNVTKEDMFKTSPKNIAVAYYQEKTAEYEK
ncbi:MAG: hypothetical protein Q9M18_04360 [Mariprofundaceae bacterium]|nr:hypothetical protein [Mariprofundaceae bacterium]